MRKLAFAIALCSVVCVTIASAQQPSGEQKTEAQPSQTMCPMHDAHKAMNDRGEKGMGFSQTATTHHFLLNSKGGVIQVEANDPADATNRAEIRMHLGHIAKAFQNGDFDIPMFVHDTVPPGVPEMKRLQKEIVYSFEQTPRGGQVLISSTDKDAIAAIYQFLRFQIAEHQTGDPIGDPNAETKPF